MGPLPAPRDDTRDVLRVRVIVVRGSADKILAVKYAELAAAASGAIQVFLGGDAAVNHRDAYSRAIPAGLPGGVCVHRGCGLVERAAQSAVGREVNDAEGVRHGIPRIHRNGIVRALNEVEFSL